MLKSLLIGHFGFFELTGTDYLLDLDHIIIIFLLFKATLDQIFMVHTFLMALKAAVSRAVSRKINAFADFQENTPNIEIWGRYYMADH